MSSAANPEALADIATKCRDEEIARNMASITSAKAMGEILNDLADRIEAEARASAPPGQPKQPKQGKRRKQ